MAKIELHVSNGQCLNRHIAKMERMKKIYNRDRSVAISYK